jgi:hypothetical protein
VTNDIDDSGGIEEYLRLRGETMSDALARSAKEQRERPQKPLDQMTDLELAREAWRFGNKEAESHVKSNWMERRKEFRAACPTHEISRMWCPKCGQDGLPEHWAVRHRVGETLELVCVSCWAGTATYHLPSAQVTGTRSIRLSTAMRSFLAGSAASGTSQKKPDSLWETLGYLMFAASCFAFWWFTR